ncbi:hypothetical protein C8R46DRAFT_1309193 [Mycena filopes]|nr:hypothetical protein C8R46DRAFT_1309193 [Mycena filopes]
MSNAITHGIPASAPTLPSASTSAPPLTRTDTVLITPTGSAADLALLEPAVPAGGSVSAPPTPVEPTNAPPLPALTGHAKAFLDRIGLGDIPSKDKRFEGKLEARQTQREVHFLAQQAAQLYADQQKDRAETTQVLEYMSAQIKAVQEPTKKLQAAVMSNARDIGTANDRLEQLELIVTNTAATVSSMESALKSLIARWNAAPGPVPPALAPLPPPPPSIPIPAPFVPNDEPSTIDRMESLLQQLVAKRAHSPDIYPDERHVRTRLADGVPSAGSSAVAFAPAAAATALPVPVSVSAAHPIPVAAAAALPVAATLPVAAALPVPAALPAIAPAPAVAAPAPIAVVAVGANPPPPLPAFDSTKEALIGPVVWGRNITGESSSVIKAVLPAAKSVMRSYRARRGPDANTIIACFESADIASWFITAFNAARVAPYESVFASPNV